MNYLFPFMTLAIPILGILAWVATDWMRLQEKKVAAVSTETAEKAGLTVVMNRCPKIEYGRLSGELGWHGFNSGVISSKRRKI